MALSEETIRIYKTIKGEIEPSPGTEVLPTWYAYHGDWRSFAKCRNDKITNSQCLAVIHGIYFNLEFARWCKDNLLGTDDTIDASISAKLIMNNDLSYIHPKIYCIWFPELASEQTYRTLYETHPEFKYQIARACVHAKYNSLFKEVDILPEVGLLYVAQCEDNQELENYIRTRGEKDGLWEVMCDTIGTIEEPERKDKSDEALPIYEFEDLYLNKEYHENMGMHPGPDIKIEDFTFSCIYYDPLRSGVISDRFVQEKLDNIGKLMQ